MVRHEKAETWFACIAGMSITLVMACGSNVPLGTENADLGGKDTATQPGTGGSSLPGAGGVLGGAGGAGGAALDAPIDQADSGGGSGGVPATGGRAGAGGAGGTLAGGAGGGTAGSTGQTCGTIAGLTCGAGQFCDLQSQCGQFSDAAGTCYAAGGVCTADWNPVCGCDGKTYSNECSRRNARVERAYTGACVDGGVGTGGRGGSGGAGGRSSATGGVGGSFTDGGAKGSGGKLGAGGVTGAGGSTGQICGSIAGLSCPQGQFCDLSSRCGTISDATGTCHATGGGCPAVWAPVCGCDGKTYPTDCDRLSAGVLKASDGECPKTDGGTATYPNGLLGWFAPGGAAGTGPAVVVSGAGWMDTWSNSAGFDPEAPPSSATATFTLTSAQTDDLFGRLAAIDLSTLPHSATGVAECYPHFYVRLCAGCAAKTIDYGMPGQLLPEMETVFGWFDQRLASSAAPTNPRNYCNF